MMLESMPYLQTYTFWLIYIGLSLAISIVAMFAFKTRYDGGGKKLFITILLFILLVPFIVHVIVLIFSIIYAFLDDKSYLNQVKHFNKNAFFKNQFPQIKRIFGEGAIVSLAKDPKNHSEYKMKGVVFMSENPSKENFGMIKGLLSDENNEVRLYSFSLLANIEGELNDKINKTLSQYEKENHSTQKAQHASTLAALYWEFIQYGLSDQETSNLILSKTKSYAKQALEEHIDLASTNLLLGKVAFFEKKFKKAHNYFNQAKESGANSVAIAPYLAEIAFEKRDFTDVQKTLSMINPMELSSKTAPLYQQWVQR